MSFEEQITRAFETLSDRLRGEIDEQVRRTAAELTAAARADREAAAAAKAAADRAGSSARLIDAVQALDRAGSLTELLDTLVTGARAEASSADVWLLRDGRLHPWRSPQSDEAIDQTPPLIEKGIPLTVGGATVALLFVEPRTPNADLLARYAARCLEVMTAFKTARALSPPAADNPDRGVRTAGSEVAARADSDQRTEEDTSARRYARLLVSEIRLYHETAVIDGRRDRDLAVRLGGEIARARVMYEQRVPPSVRGRADYFHDELVQTLADGDSSLLEVTS
jgi:hypothetical protein